MAITWERNGTRWDGFVGTRYIGQVWRSHPTNPGAWWSWCHWELPNDYWTGGEGMQPTRQEAQAAFEAGYAEYQRVGTMEPVC